MAATGTWLLWPAVPWELPEFLTAKSLCRHCTAASEKHLSLGGHTDFSSFCCHNQLTEAPLFSAVLRSGLPCCLARCDNPPGTQDRWFCTEGAAHGAPRRLPRHYWGHCAVSGSSSAIRAAMSSRADPEQSGWQAQTSTSPPQADDITEQQAPLFPHCLPQRQEQTQT